MRSSSPLEPFQRFMNSILILPLALLQPQSRRPWLQVGYRHFDLHEHCRDTVDGPPPVCRKQVHADRPTTGDVPAASTNEG